MPDSSATSVPPRTTFSHNPQAVRATSLLSPDQARTYLSITHDQLLNLVRTARLRTLRNPAGQLCFSTDDLDEIPVGVPPEVAVAALTNLKETYVVDASIGT